jgi:hypothetical protein
MTTTTRGARKESGRSPAETARDAAGSLADAAGELEERLAGAAEMTEAGVRAANDRLRERSDASLGLLGSFSVGLAAGLLLGGANRLLIAVALIPAALVGGILLERMDRPRRASRPN